MIGGDPVFDGVIDGVEIGLGNGFGSGSTMVVEELIVGSVEVHDRDGTRWRAGFRAHRACDRRDGSDTIGEVIRDEIGNDAAVGHAGCVDSVWVDVLGFDKLIDEGICEGDIINVIVHGISAAHAAVPREFVFKATGAIWIGDDKAHVIGFVIEPGEAIHGIGVTAAAMVGNDERQGMVRGGFMICGEMEEVRAREFSDSECVFGCVGDRGEQREREGKGKKFHSNERRRR